jgi:hypothetical protein
MTYDFVEGTTDPLQFQLLENGVPIDLTGVTVVVLIEDRTGTSQTLGSIVLVDALNGKIKFYPLSITSFVASLSPYYVRWQLNVDSTGAISYIPSTSRDVWNVVGV